MTAQWKPWAGPIIDSARIAPPPALPRWRRLLNRLLRRKQHDGRTYAWVVGTTPSTPWPVVDPETPKFYLAGQAHWTILPMWQGSELTVHTDPSDTREFLWLVDGVPQDETGLTLKVEAPAEGKRVVEAWAAPYYVPTELGRPVIDHRGDAPTRCPGCGGGDVIVRTGRDHAYLTESDLATGKYERFGITEPGRYVTLWDAWTCPACPEYGPVWYAATG